MGLQRLLDRMTRVFAVIACLLFVLGLRDSPRLAPLSPVTVLPMSEGVVDRDAAIEVTAVLGGGTPVEGATVRVLWHEAGRYYLAATGRTGPDGKARFDALPRGVAWVLAEGPGLARSSTQIVLVPGLRSLTMTLQDAYQLRVTVTDEAQRPLPRATVLVDGGDPLPFGALTSADGVVSFTRVGPAPYTVKASAFGYESVTNHEVQGPITIQLRHLGSLVVRVEDPNGAAAPGATVHIAGSSLWPARQSQTDAAGVARISGLLAGTYELKANRDQLVSDTLSGVVLQRGAQDQVTLRLGIGRMIPVVVMDGDDEAATGVPDADVVLAEWGISSFPLRGRTAADGTVTLGPVAPGPATITARASGFVARGAVAVPDPIEGPVRVALLRGATLEGEVVDTRGFPIDGASVEVVGTDLYGLPIAETPALRSFERLHFAWAMPGSVPLIPMGELGVMPGPVPPIPPPGSMAGASTSASPQPIVDVDPADPWVSRSDGTFTAFPVTPGRVRALVRHPSYVAGLSDMVTLAPGGRAEVRVVLHAGGLLEGRVIDDRGFPVSGTRVDVTSTTGTFERTTLTATDGSFAFAAVPEQVWIGVARPEDPSKIVHRESATVKDDDRTTIEIQLAPARDPTRIVVLTDTAQPVPGAQVTVLSLDPETPLRQTQFADSDGSVSVSDCQGLPARVLVEAPGWVRAVQTVHELPERIEIALQRGVVIRGTITAIRGRRFVDRAQITILADGLRQVTLTDPEGVFEVRDVAPGPVRVTVAHPDYATVERTVEVVPTGQADRPFEIDPIDLDEAGSIEGEVVDRTGAPVMAARVAIGFAPAYLPVGVSGEATVQTDSQGRFRIRNLAPGSVDLDAYAPGVGRGSAAGVEVLAGRLTTGVRIRIDDSPGESDDAALGSVAVTLGVATDGVSILHVAEYSEAERAGLAAGDRLLLIDGSEPRDPHDARQRLSGPVGSDVVVELQREDQTLSLRVAREAVRH